MDVDEPNPMEVGEEESDDEVSSEESEEGEVYLPGKPIAEEENLVCDETAYVMLHQAHTGAPCLSFDIIPDDLGERREEFPLTSYLVAGTQAARTHVNNVIIMKMSNLHRTSTEKKKKEEDDESESEEEEEDIPPEKLPQMQCALIKHQGCVNRIRVTRHSNSILAASWSELGQVNVWNLNQQLTCVNDPALLSSYEKSSEGNRTKPLYTFSGHQQEGFAMDWSPTVSGVLATGDCRRDIHLWQPGEGGTWAVDQRPLIGHTDSVEDLQWSPNERSVLASCSVDKSIRIWDSRASPAKACMLTCDSAHDSDINVISWNRNEPLIVSGGDDGVLHVWDLRTFTTKTPIATFKHHTNYISTVEWHPTDSSVLASGGADNQIALWDLSVERDAAEEGETVNEELKNLPPQLLFIHQGQTDIKELHWHPQLPGVILSTANSGFNIFRTISV
ncbi:glutamate-rich WD repeat-containing protein 1 [Lutzomyia longipalpis]|uniref:glutamate-rich WD repeat-containing protein 1 n=1 Tax=Lutzomyia longipalpis TaxID=7200 RepID=UPI002483EF8D|nr:glutamate-rich WD repeat-containing protein 1 [Lutzomyia longipalpis]